MPQLGRLAAALVLLNGAASASASNIDLDSSTVELTTQNFEKTNNGLWLMKFYAPWCGHCKKLAPTYEKIANYFHRRAKQGVHVGKIDATEHAGLASRFDIKGYPTLILYRDGQKVADYTGARTFDAIVAWVEQHEGKDGDGGGGGGQAAPAAPAKATSRGGRPSAGGRTAKAGPGLRTWLLALLTEHDPVSVGLTMLGVAGLFCVSLLIFICTISPEQPA